MSIRMRDLLTQARGELRYEPVEKRVRADAVVDSTRAILVWEPRRVVPSYAVPSTDISVPLGPAPTSTDEAAGVLHPGIPFGVHTAAGESVTIEDRTGAGFRLADVDLAGYVVLDFTAFDEWFEEDERIFGHPRDPYHRVDVRQSARSVRIEVGGEALAETTRARLLFETNLPLRFYLPREDVRGELEPGSRAGTYCAYKGRASYWTLNGHEDVAWSYEAPLPDAVAITGLVAFWDERVDVVLDGTRRDPPGGAISEALRDEFGV
jgi:uncharacterized protein (DUF427 family)